MMFDIVRPDPLQILTSTKSVVEESRWVALDHEAVGNLADRIGDLNVEIQAWGDDPHFSDGSWRTAGWVFVLDALNFCFWSVDADRRWRVEYGGRLYDGYWALVAALRRAVDEGIALWDAEVLRSLELPTVTHLLRPSDPADPLIPLLPERHQHLVELGEGLVRFEETRQTGDPPVVTFLRECRRSAVHLVQEVVRWFPSFNDVASWNGLEVRFFKRAQILAADLHAAFGGTGPGAFDDLEQLTAFADYKVPQVLRRLGVLRYDEELAATIDARRLIPAGSPEEIEIRAATVWGVELIRQRLAERGVHKTAVELDWALWQAGQHASTNDRPYHRTLTIYY